MADNPTENFTPIPLENTKTQVRKTNSLYLYALVGLGVLSVILISLLGLIFIKKGTLKSVAKLDKANSSVQNPKKSSSAIQTAPSNKVNKSTIPFAEWLTFKNKGNDYQFKYPYPEYTTNPFMPEELNLEFPHFGTRGGEIGFKVWQSVYITDCVYRKNCVITSQEKKIINNVTFNKFKGNEKLPNTPGIFPTDYPLPDLSIPRAFVAYEMQSPRTKKSYSIILESPTANISKDNIIPIAENDEELFDQIVETFTFIDSNNPVLKTMEETIIYNVPSNLKKVIIDPTQSIYLVSSDYKSEGAVATSGIQIYITKLSFAEVKAFDIEKKLSTLKDFILFSTSTFADSNEKTFSEADLIPVKVSGAEGYKYYTDWYGHHLYYSFLKDDFIWSIDISTPNLSAEKVHQKDIDSFITSIQFK